MTALSVIALAPTPEDERLAALADRVREESALASNAAIAVVEHAIRAGEALIEAHRLVPRGEWQRWLQAQFPEYHPSTLTGYKRIAEHKEFIRSQNPETVRIAKRILVSRVLTPADEEKRAEAARLRKTGMTYAEIGAEFGVGWQAIREWLNPQRADARRRRRQQQSRAARRYTHHKARQAAVQKKGGDVAKAYAYVRKAVEALESAAETEKDPTVNQALNSAMHRLYAGEDFIVAASKRAPEVTA